MLLLVPAFDEGGPAVLRGPSDPARIPISSMSAPLHVPHSWLLNLHPGRREAEPT